MKILIAEDDQQIAEGLIKNFYEEEIETDWVTDGDQAIENIINANYDLVILDWRMPKRTGVEVCRKLREDGNNIPIILLTALSDVSNKVQALDYGADDYITKPFSFKELKARIMAITRRNNRSKITFDSFTIDLIDHKLLRSGDEIKLSEKEFELLYYFIQNKGIIITKEELCKNVWKLNFVPETNIVEATVKNLRKKLETNSDKKHIKNIYGEGYIFLTE